MVVIRRLYRSNCPVCRQARRPDRHIRYCTNCGSDLEVTHVSLGAREIAIGIVVIGVIISIL